MNNVKIYKLLFGKYLYKITLMNVLGSIFRGKNFTYAGEILDSLQQDYENGQPLVRKTFSKEFKILLMLILSIFTYDKLLLFSSVAYSFK